MRILHLLKTAPDDQTRLLVARLSDGTEAETIELFKEEVNYETLVEKIFACDKVLSWW